MKSCLMIIGLIAALLFTVYWGWGEHQAKGRLEKAAKGKPATGQSIIQKIYVDTGGRQHIVLRDVPVTPQQLKEGSAVSPAYVDTLAKALNIAAKRITDVTVAKISAEGEARLYKTQVDSLKRQVLYFQNKFFQASYVQGTDSLKYSYHLTLNNVGYSKQKTIFGNTYFYHDVFTDDKNAVLNNVDRYTVADHVKTFSFALQAKTIYDFKSGQLIPAAGVEVGINRLTFTGGYYYNHVLNNFNPTIGAKFDVLKFER